MTKINPSNYININGTVVDTSTVEKPDNRIFRDAWVLSSDTLIEVDMSVAKEIQKDRVRIEREEYFKNLDSEWFRASEENNIEKLEEIKEKKKVLRDVTKDSRFNKAKKPADLVKLTLKNLVGF